MKYSSAEIVNPDFYIDFIEMLTNENGKKALDKLTWYLGLDGFDKDSHINAYRTGARDLLSLLKKWGDPQYKKQLENRREVYDRAKHESDNKWSGNSSASIGEFSGAGKPRSKSGNSSGKSDIMVR